MNLNSSLCLLPLSFWHLHAVRDPNVGDQRPTIDLLDVPLDKADELVRIARDPARLQRARQGPGESPTQGGDEMV